MLTFFIDFLKNFTLGFCFVLLCFEAGSYFVALVVRPGTCYVDQAGFELNSTCLFLLRNRIKGYASCLHFFLSPQLSKTWHKGPGCHQA